MGANDYQVGGSHYKSRNLQHWDMVIQTNMPYLVGQATKYVSRWRDKNGVQDLMKAVHFNSKALEHSVITPDICDSDLDTILKWLSSVLDIDYRSDADRNSDTINRFCDQLGSEESTIVMSIYIGDYNRANHLIADLIASEVAGPGPDYIKG